MISDTWLEISLLARLQRGGRCRYAKRNERLFQRFRAAGWIEEVVKNQWQLKGNARPAVIDRLNVLLPTWEQDILFLERKGLNPFDPSDLASVFALRKQPVRMPFINRRNWYAITGKGPKDRARVACPDTLTRDWILRIRPNEGLKAIFGDTDIDIYAVASLLSEYAIPERGWRRITAFGGVLPKNIITTENLGAFTDMPMLPQTTIVFSPGKDVGPAAGFLDKLPESRWYHFGDLDPEGIKIARHLAKVSGRQLSLLVPSFIDEYLGLGPSLGKQWEGIGEDIPLLANLRAKGRGLYQEFFMLDPRLQNDPGKVLKV